MVTPAIDRPYTSQRFYQSYRIIVIILSNHDRTRRQMQKKEPTYRKKKCQEVISYVNNTDIHKVMRIVKLYADKNK